MAAVEESVQERAANLRSMVEADLARVEAIGVELADLDVEIRAVTADAVATNPTGSLSVAARGIIKKLTDTHGELVKERSDIETLLPYRGQLLEQLEEECRLLGFDEMRAQRELIYAGVRSNLGLCAEMFSGMVAVWSGEFLRSLEALAEFNADAQLKGFPEIGCPIEAVPTDIPRLVELLMHAAQIKESNAGAGFVYACDLHDNDGEDLVDEVRAAHVRYHALGASIPRTSWASMHGEG